MSLLNDILEHKDLAPGQLTAYIDEYASIQPYDCMIDTARAVVALSTQDFDSAKDWILSAIRKNPANYMNHFYFALIAKNLKKYAVAAKECLVTANFATQFGAPAGWESLIEQLNMILSEAGTMLSQEERTEFFIQRNILNSFGSYFPAYYLYEQKKYSIYQGRFLYFDRQKAYNDYVCIKAQSMFDIANYTYQQVFPQIGNYNNYVFAPTLAPIEVWKAKETNRFAVEKKNYILAVAATKPEQTMKIFPAKGESVSFELKRPNIYHYINMDEPGVICSDQKFILSKPIPTEGVPGKPKLILNIFIDALSQYYLNKTNLQYMPYTKAFFEKGMVFKNCYSTAEWTQPSFASLATGLYTTRHHVIYHSSAYQFPQHINTVGEIFDKDDFFTVRVSGSIGTSPYMGGLRGFNSSVHKSVYGFPDNQLIEDAIDYMEAFPLSNKYISLELYSPHSVTESAREHPLNLNMFQQTALGFRDTYINTVKEKSVRAKCSAAAVKRYQIALRECDRQLKKIFDYVTSCYAEDEYIVCLYSDHGAAILSEETYLLKAAQTNSVLMLRGAGVSAGISEEYINHIDYLPILTKMAGIDADFSRHDCVLPRTFGGPGRDYVYTESIYQGQTYKAAVRTDEFECRFEANANTDIDGMIDLSKGYSQKIFSMQTGEEIHDAELAEDFEGIVFDHIKENIKY